jgi:hypothetical protein
MSSGHLRLRTIRVAMEAVAMERLFGLISILTPYPRLM